MVGDSFSSYKIDYVTKIWDILHLKGQKNCITSSKVMAVYLKEWILPVSGVALIKGLRVACVAGSFSINHPFDFY